MKRGLKYKIMGPIFGGFLLVLIILVALAIIIPKGQITKIGEDKGKTLSKITAESLMSALMFDDAESCKGNLANLTKDEAVLVAEVFDKTGKSVAKIINVKYEDKELEKEKKEEMSTDYSAAFDPKALPDIGKDAEDKEMKDMSITTIEIAGQQCKFFSSRIVNSDSQELMGYLNIALSLKSVQEATSTISTSMILISLISLLLIGFVSNMIITRMIKPLIDASDMMGVLSEGEGDLTARLEIKSNDEIGKLAENFNRFIEKLRDIIMQVKDAATEINDGTGEISAGSEDLSTRTSEQAASITQTSTTLEGFTAIVKVNTENSGDVREKLENFNAEMQTKKDLMDNVTSTMKEIEDSSKKIDNIITVINDISFQTNLLALNAAVEAARAGEAGRGFAVVASEVRNLAQKTAESSKTIQDIVTQNVGSTKKGMELVNETSAFFTAIVEIMNELVLKISEISDGSKEQSTGVEQINQAIMQLENVINQNAALVEELSATSKSMSSNTHQLNSLVNRFKF
jgi:methyl-accepting chemotaxis protein